jgi:hypothetical protein
MKGMAIEFIFKMFLYVVVILVVISLIIHFREEILTTLNLCDYVPGGCQKREECTPIQSTETSITEIVLKKYCDLCWLKTGEKNYPKDCICYIVKGSFSPSTFTLSDYCDLRCNKEATSVIFTYNQLLKKVLIEC